MVAVNENKPVSRKKVVVWTVAVLSILTAGKHLLRSRRGNTKTTLKVLTQDGKLVEVDASKVAHKKRKIDDGEIFRWVKQRSSL
ncbi:MAG TPA: hypothetical protein VGQ53_08230 [Chitinophagaceae bacterium]|jgi:hypothetical protein|nr:hypothetical protein [Chitinophagaceae bacterium]